MAAQRNGSNADWEGDGDDQSTPVSRPALGLDERPASEPETPTDQLHVLSRNEEAPAEEDHGVDNGWSSRLDEAVRGAGRHVLEVAPRLERPLQRLRYAYSTAFVRLVQTRSRLGGRAEVDPFRVFYVSPDEIVRVSEPTGLSRFRRVGMVADGDWDRSPVRFTDTDLFHAFRARFRNDVPWEETRFFQRIADEIADGHEPWGCDSKTALLERCRGLDSLYDSVREQGFLTQRELTQTGTTPPLDRERGTVATRIINDEIAVDIARDGELLYADGRNRLAMAKVLGVEEIPVIVLRRHRQWADLRDAVAGFVAAGGSVPQRLRRHPDIQPLLDD